MQINVTCNGSTGRIMEQIQKEAEKNGYEAISFYGRGKPSNDNCIKIDTNIDILWHALISRFFNLQGHGSIFATYRLIRKIKRINPDIIHLHNIHGYYINFKMLFGFLKSQNIPVVWTLHDCWAFTGHCAYYTANNCEKWKVLCDNCEHKKTYPKTYFFGSRINKEYLKKKELISKLDNLVLTVPSEWLKKQVKMSYLKDNQVEVIHNCIDITIFKPIIDDDLKKKYKIDADKKIILGVAAQWNQNKGIDYFKRLSKIIDKGKETIVMVGLTDRQIQELPKNIIGIKKTESIEELAKLYSMADVFFNPSIQETFSMVTLESIACGTPCVVMDSTATPELIQKKECGIIEKDFNINRIYQDIKEILMTDKNIKACINFAKKYDIERGIQKYLDIYNKIIRGEEK